MKKNDFEKLATALYRHLRERDRRALYNAVEAASEIVCEKLDSHEHLSDAVGEGTVAAKSVKKELKKLHKDSNLIQAFGCALEMEQF